MSPRTDHRHIDAAGNYRERPVPHEIDWGRFEAVLLDLDGVITPTAEVHQRAWAALFATYDYTDADYLAHIDGKPRYDGVRTFLASRGVTLPEGDPADPPGDDSVCALGNRKDATFNALLDAEGIEPYPGTIAVLDLLDELGTPQAVVSSSKNARRVLHAAGLGDRFEVVVDGIVAVEQRLPGKPAPDTFLHAADRLGTAPSAAAVVEDAVSGVVAGRAGGFGLVLGIDRGGNRAALVEAGAHLVVDDLADTLHEGVES
jgi:beta-phosphoglucomutase family hydrolase